MFEEHNPILRFIFANGRGWLGKLAASTIIGGIVCGGFALTSREYVQEWDSFTAIGATMGFFAALILISRDIAEGIEVDDETGTRRIARSSGWGVVLMLISS